jgi:8-oxo-dGTP diphosphatase
MRVPSEVIVTGVFVKKSDNTYLLVKKADNVGPYNGTYTPSGGHLNPGERIDDAALRELYEETGVRVTNLKRVYFDDAITEDWAGDMRHFIGLLYTADFVSGDLQPTAGNDDVFDDVNWFSVQQMSQLALSPPVIKLLMILGLTETDASA